MPVVDDIHVVGVVIDVCFVKNEFYSVVYNPYSTKAVTVKSPSYRKSSPGYGEENDIFDYIYTLKIKKRKILLNIF